MSADVEMLRDLVAQVATDLPDEGGPGALPPAWDALRELGLAQVGAADGDGGLAAAVAVAEALGAHGVSSPLVDASVAAWAAGSAAHEERLATFAFAAGSVRADGALSVRVTAVPWARAADDLVLLGHDGAVLVALDGAGVTLEPGVNVAGEQRDDVVLQDAPGRVLDGAPSAAQARARHGLLWAAALIGAGRGALALTAGYVKEREQFGAPLVRLGPVASGLAEMRTALTEGEAALRRAARRLEDDPSDADDAVAVARIVAARTATTIAELAHQLHGAMGMTLEYPLHRFTRRLWAWRDAGTPEAEWARALGARAAGTGEHEMWERLTA